MIPGFDINPSEYVASNLNFSQIQGQINNSQIGSNVINSSNIQTGAVGTAQIAPNAVGTAQIATGAVTASNIQNNTITNAQLSPSASIPPALIGPFTGSTTALTNNVTTNVISTSFNVPAGKSIAIITSQAIVNWTSSNADYVVGQVTMNSVVGANINSTYTTWNLGISTQSPALYVGQALNMSVPITLVSYVPVSQGSNNITLSFNLSLTNFSTNTLAASVLLPQIQIACF